MPDTKEKFETVHLNNLGMIDFSDSCLKLGVKTEGKAIRWTELDEDDWKILRLLLVKPLLPNGQTAAVVSKSLHNIAAYAEAVVEWYAENKRK